MDSTVFTVALPGAAGSSRWLRQSPGPTSGTDICISALRPGFEWVSKDKVEFDILK